MDKKNLDYRGFVIRYDKEHVGDFPYKVNNASYMNPKQAKDAINQHLAQQRWESKRGY